MKVCYEVCSDMPLPCYKDISCGECKRTGDIWKAKVFHQKGSPVFVNNEKRGGN